ncbi:MAG: hypothetical protein B6D64_13800 [Bacteroidetes bacterium 4484_276]|nr:MAG: hypothetical protein B6D64_13800 [Bacteroidetes bacterium 4484_276]
MSKITIRNIGPIKDVTLNLNKVNVIMGPQSSGKSTIAKIISYCQWVEKRFILDGEFKYDFSEQFMDFHRISEVYFSNDSLIEYKSNDVEISYSGKKKIQKIQKITKGFGFVNHKNIYIPAERNFVSVIPDLGKYKRINDNIMNFLYDWYEVKKKYTKEKEFSILNLQASYYHIKATDSDILVLNETKKEILLNNASSGLQSVIPMLILIDYLTKGLFDENRTVSVDERTEMNKMIREVINDSINKIDTNEKRDKLLENFEKEQKTFTNLIETQKIINNIIEAREYNYSQFIIEEPEQNLFPEAQRDLVYNIIHLINSNERDHKLLITTHSSYILYALNNCMMGYLIKDDMPNEEQDELKSKLSWIDPKLVSVWEIEKDKGTIKLIQDAETGTVSKHYFNRIMNEVMDEYYEMLNYLEI